MLQKITEAKEITHSDLLQAFHYCMDKVDLSRCIDTLLDEESIEREVVPTKTKSRVIYKPVEKKKEG